MVVVLGAGYTGLTTAAELTLRGYKAHIIASDLGYRPPLTIVGTQSRVVFVSKNFINFHKNTRTLILSISVKESNIKNAFAVLFYLHGMVVKKQ